MPPHEFPTDGTLYVDPRPDMDPALASLLKTLQGKLRDMVSEVTTFEDAPTTTDENPRPKLDDAWRVIQACIENVCEWLQKERARIQASTMSADDKTEWSRRLDDDGTFFKDMVSEAMVKLARAVFRIKPDVDIDIRVLARRA